MTPAVATAAAAMPSSSSAPPSADQEAAIRAKAKELMETDWATRKEAVHAFKSHATMQGASLVQWKGSGCKVYLICSSAAERTSKGCKRHDNPTCSAIVRLRKRSNDRWHAGKQLKEEDLIHSPACTAQIKPTRAEMIDALAEALRKDPEADGKAMLEVLKGKGLGTPNQRTVYYARRAAIDKMSQNDQGPSSSAVKPKRGRPPKAKRYERPPEATGSSSEADAKRVKAETSVASANTPYASTSIPTTITTITRPPPPQPQPQPQPQPSTSSVPPVSEPPSRLEQWNNGTSGII